MGRVEVEKRLELRKAVSLVRTKPRKEREGGERDGNGSDDASPPTEYLKIDGPLSSRNLGQTFIDITRAILAKVACISLLLLHETEQLGPPCLLPAVH